MKNPPMKHPTKGEKMTKDARTHVLANEKSSNETPNEGRENGTRCKDSCPSK
jgi:hypothetical protein